MILVTGGTGFIGQHLIRRLVGEGHSVRTLIRPSDQSPQLPPGVAVEAAISSLTDERGLRAALVGVDVVYHLASPRWSERNPDWNYVEVEGALTLLEAAQDAGVERILYMSHIGANRASAYPLLKAKGIVEQRIRRSPIPYTILRSALVFGPRDNLTVPLAQMLAIAPGLFPIPSQGGALVQPLWVEDLVSCLVWSLDDEDSLNALHEIGGPEHLTFRYILEQVMAATGIQRTLVNVRPSYMRVAASLTPLILPRLPVSTTWLDYLAGSRITELDALPRVYDLLPARFSRHLDHLHQVDWRAAMMARLFGRPA